MKNTISLLFFLTTSIWACSNPQSDGHGSMETMQRDEHMMHEEHGMKHGDHMMMTYSPGFLLGGPALGPIYAGPTLVTEEIRPAK